MTRKVHPYEVMSQSSPTIVIQNLRQHKVTQATQKNSFTNFVSSIVVIKLRVECIFLAKPKMSGRINHPIELLHMLKSSHKAYLK